ncbi:MAG: hypothetical protein HKN94_06190 [Acidimicrobiales bacterium]|nr:hypothetical protein [Acidimicrobiales bacterium]
MTEVRRLRVRYGDDVTDLEVLLPPHATIEVLADILGAADSSLSINGRVLPAWHSLDQSGVFDGVVLDIDRPNSLQSDDHPVVVVDQLAGLPGGDSRLLPQGTFGFSASPEAENAFSLEVSDTGRITVLPGVSPVVIDNVRITGRTALTDRILNAGASRYTIGQLPPSGIPIDPSTTRQRTRSAIGSTVRSVTPPVLPRLEPEGFPMAWLGTIPVVLLLVVVGFVASPAFFAVAAVILAATTAALLVRRMSRQKEVRDHHERTKRLVETFEKVVVAARRSVEQELRLANPSIPELARAARGEVAGYWNRSRGDRDFANVVVGYGEVDWEVQVDSEFELTTALQQIVDDNSLLTSVPIVADLTMGPVGIVGPRDFALPCARAIAVTLATQSSASDLRISLAADENQLGQWDWLKWLPQLNPTHPIAVSPHEADRMVSSWRTPGHDWLQAVLVDQPKWAIDRNSLLSLVADEPGKQTLVIVAEDIDDLPACSTTIEIGDDGVATVTADEVVHRFVSPVAAATTPTDTIARGAAWLHREFGEDPVGITATGVRPFHIESRRRDFAAADEPVLMPTDDARVDDTVSVAEPTDVIENDGVADTGEFDGDDRSDDTRWSQRPRDLD